MKMWIPTIGDMLRLTEDWTIILKPESRNWDLRELVVPEGSKWGYDDSPLPFTLVSGTVLKVDRIYIRSHYRDYDSYTFRTVASPDPRLSTKKMGGAGKSRRFFAHLSDVNNMQAEKFNV
jgi:hypothetical protein